MVTWENHRKVIDCQAASGLQCQRNYVFLLHGWGRVPPDIFTLTWLTIHAMQPLDPVRDAPSSCNIPLAPSIEEANIIFTVRKSWFKKFHSLSQSKFQSKKGECGDERKKLITGVPTKA